MMDTEPSSATSSRLQSYLRPAGAMPILVENLCKQWDGRRADARCLAEMTFVDNELQLGAGTSLGFVKRNVVSADHASPDGDARLLLLFGAAYRRPIRPQALTHIRRAIVWKGEGGTAMALTHLALTGLGRLPNPVEDSRRLFIADGLLTAGANPRDILLALELDMAPLDALMRKYSPDQPRVPAGNGRESGQWVGANANGAAPEAPTAQRRVSILPIIDATYPGDFHDQLRDDFAEALRKAGNTVLTEVPLILIGDPPVPARIDILFRTPAGLLYGIDVKTGPNSRFTPQQEIVYPHALVGGMVVAPDLRISALGLIPGKPLPPIDIHEVYADGPGAPLEMAPLTSYLRNR